MVKALLVGVSEYADPRNNLPKCLNDLYAMKKALNIGLSVNLTDILLCGECGSVSVDEYRNAFKSISKAVNIEDTFVFYFSGHGAKKDLENYLAFSDGFISVKEIIKLIDDIKCKNKLVLIDSCHSGNKNIDLEPSIDVASTVDELVGHGCAVMASCDFDERSGFDPNLPLSLYTRILYDAFTNRFLIREGKKSLEDIKNYVDRLSNIANKTANPVQHNAFRSSIVGTIFFDVEKYTPYKIAKICKETDKYIICSVNPVHANVKRISLEVILKYPCTEADVADITNEIKEDALHYEVYSSQISEKRFSGLPNNILFMYFGYDETDIINHNYSFRSIWVDEYQDKAHWYRKSNSSVVINDIFIERIKYYDFTKKIISESIADNNELMKMTRDCMYKMIKCAEKYISEFREYINRTISEQELVSNTRMVASEIRKLYFQQSDFSIASNDLHEWQNAFANLAAVIDDFVLCYDSNSMNNRDSKNRMQLFELTIDRYNKSLEIVKQIDSELAIRLNKTGD